MRRFGSEFGLLVVLVLLIGACRHSFDPPVQPATSRPLVIEGSILAGSNAVTTVALSRVQDVSKAGTPLQELNAQVSIEDEGNNQHGLHDNGDGTYSSDPLNLAAGQSYRLNISTSNGGKYLSDFVEAKSTPPVDSLEWQQDGDATVYVNTHDPSDSTRYYRWDYIETWNYVSNLTTPWGLSGTTVFVKDSLTQTDSCWRTAYSTDVLISTSAALSHDVISHFPVATIVQGDERISNRYSILVRQYAITKEAYEFHSTLKKNTEQTGSLYDPQPSGLSTNLHCISNPAETVLGFISASSVEEKRIFIRHTEVSDWVYHGSTIDCSQMTIAITPETNFYLFNYSDTSFAPYYFLTSSPYMVIAKKACLSCTYFGGTNQKPSFW